MSIDLKLIGTSDYPAFVQDASKYVTPHTVWNRIVRGINSPAGDAARLGQLNERSTARLYLERVENYAADASDEDLIKVPEMRQPPGREWMRYHASDFHDAGETMLIECKNRSRWVMDKWGADGSDEVDMAVYAQVQGQLEAIRYDRDRWAPSALPEVDEVRVAVVVDGMKLRHFKVRRDEEVGGILVDAAERFWRDYVLTSKPPPVDGSEGADKMLASLWPAHSKNYRDPSAEEIEVIRDYREIVEEMEALGKRLKIKEQLLKKAISDDMGLEGSDFRIRWTQYKGRVSMKAVLDEVQKRLGLSADQRKQLEEKHRGAGSRRFQAQFY